MKTLDELFTEEENLRTAADRIPTPQPGHLTGEALEAYMDAYEERLRAEHEKGVRLGWWDEDGEPIEDPDEEEEEIQ